MNRLYSRFEYRNLGFLPGDPTDVPNTVREHNVAVCCLLYIFLIAAVSQLLCSTPALAQDSKNVLVLYGNTAELPWVKIFDASLRSTVKSRSSLNVDFYTEYFDVARFPAAKYGEAFIDLLRTRYVDRHIDIIVLGGGTAFDFLMSRRTSFFPAVPIVYSFLPPGKVVDRLPPKVVGVPVDFSPMPTIELALRLHPGTKRLVLVTGAGVWDRAWEKRLRQETSALRDRLQLEFLSGLPTAQLLERLSALPKDAVVFTPGYFNDGAGSVFVPRDSVETLAAKSAVAIYAPYETMLEAGAVGGVIPTFEAIGRQTGDIVADLLDGKSLSALDLPRLMTGAPLVDWRQVQRWRIDAKLLPAETIVRFKQPSVWEQYGWYIIGALAIIALQAALIAALLLQRARRRRVETKLRENQNFMELSTGAGELGLWVRDTEGGELWANPRLRSLFGFGQKDVLRFEDLIGRIDPEDRARVVAEVEGARGAGDSFAEEFRVMMPDGSERWVAARGRIVDESSGKDALKRRMGVVLDITDRKRAEQEIQRLKERLEEENIYLKEEISEVKGFEDIIGKSDALKYVLTRAEQVAQTDATVLLLGETGVGKELIARAIHKKSLRSNNPIVKVNCATLPEALVESELFGHEKGAFTGAGRQRKGRFELADGGTIFLDEVGELPAGTQAKLLRVLQEGEFERLGGSTTIKVSVRVIAATNRELSEEVAAGRFRQDLFYRLNVYPITIPPLRERREDIPLLVSHYAHEIGGRLGKSINEVPAQVMREFTEYDWPGNIRELQNVIERAVIVSSEEVLRLPEPLAKATTAPAVEGDVFREPIKVSTLDEAEREHILRALEATGWRIEGPKGAAALLKLHPSTLRFRMKKLGLTKVSTYRPHQANKSTLH
jgi:formate hydrogenlyase transcriptional activator